MKTSLLVACIVLAVVIGVAMLLLPGYAATAGKTYYVPGYATGTNSGGSSSTVTSSGTYFQTQQLLKQVNVIVPQAVTVLVYAPYGDYWVSFTNASMAALPAYAGGVALGGFKIVRNSTSVGKIILRVNLENTKELSEFFDYINVYLYYVVVDPKTDVPQYVVVKAKLSLDSPTALIELTDSDFKNVCVGYLSGSKCPVDASEKTLFMFITASYGVKPNVTVTQVPIDLRIDVIGAYPG